MTKLVPTLQEEVENLQTLNLSILRCRLERGNILHRIKENRAYIGYDGYCETWEQFLDAIGLERETTRAEIKIYQEFSLFILGNPEYVNKCRFERLYKLLPLVDKPVSNEKKLDLLDMSIRSNRTDFENNLRELKGKIPTDSCGRCFERVQKFEKCMYCGKFRIIEDI